MKRFIFVIVFLFTSIFLSIFSLADLVTAKQARVQSIASAEKHSKQNRVLFLNDVKESIRNAISEGRTSVVIYLQFDYEFYIKETVDKITKLGYKVSFLENNSQMKVEW